MKIICQIIWLNYDSLEFYGFAFSKLFLIWCHLKTPEKSIHIQISLVHLSFHPIYSISIKQFSCHFSTHANRHIRICLLYCVWTESLLFAIDPSINSSCTAQQPKSSLSQQQNKIKLTKLCHHRQILFYPSIERFFLRPLLLSKPITLRIKLYWLHSAHNNNLRCDAMRCGAQLNCLLLLLMNFYFKTMPSFYILMAGKSVVSMSSD